MKVRTIPFLILSLCCLHTYDISANDQTVKLDKVNLKEFFSMPLLAIVQGYRKVLGKGIRSFCPMQPSCSTYGQYAVREHGLFGLINIADRLNRCGHDTHLYPMTFIRDRLLYFDPLPTNDR